MQEVFLGSSQTFFGTLATLTLLCVFYNDGNFIFKILEKVSETVNVQINNTKSGLKFEKEHDYLRSHPSFKVLNDYLNNRTQQGAELYKDGLALKKRISESQLKLSVENVEFQHATTMFSKNDKQLKEDPGIQELLVSPFYSFLFTILLFFYDELYTCGNFIEFKDEITTSLSIFIYLSFLLWAVVWIKHAKKWIMDFGCNNSTEKEDNHNDKKHYDSFISYYIKKILDKVLHGFICLIFILLICHYFPIPIITRRLFLVLSIGLPVIFIGLGKLRKIKEPKYTHNMALGHFIVLFIISLVITSLIFIGTKFSYYVDSTLFYYEDLSFLKYSALAFVILNGFVIPFSIPYLSILYPLYFVQNQRKIYHKQLNTIIRDLDSFIRKINLPS